MNAFVGDVRERVALDPNELQACRVRDGDGFVICAGENLDAAGEAARVFHRETDRGHRGGDLGADAAAQIRDVVHVLDRDAMHTAIAVDAGVGDGVLDDLADRAAARGRARQRVHVHHRYHRPLGSEHGVGHRIA